MPLPLLPATVIGAAFLLGGYGAKKGLDAYSDQEDAETLNVEAQSLLKNAERRLKRNRKACRKSLEDLGRLKFAVWDRQLGRFVSIFEQLRGVDLTGIPAVERIEWSPEDPEEIRKLSGFATEAVEGGFAGAVGGAALVAMASFGGGRMLAAAATGPALSSLAGVAATNATVAWFVGPTLTVGGVAAAGGVAILGGIAAGPVLAIAGGFAAAKAKENLGIARGNVAFAREQEAEMDAAGAMVRGIRRMAEHGIEVISAMDERVTPVLDRFDNVIKKHGTDFRQYPDDAKLEVYLAVQFAACLKALLETPILTKDGAVDSGHQEVLETGRKLLAAQA